MGDSEEIVERIRRCCAHLPQVQERPSHGAPTFFVRGKQSFLMVWHEGHHDHDFPHLWCAAAEGVQGELIASNPQRFFRPPYVGHRGWVGLRLDPPVTDGELEELCEDAYRAVASAALVRRLESQSQETSP